MTGVAGWAELDLEARANVVHAACGIGLTILIGYAAVRMMKTQQKLEKRLHLDDEDGGSTA